MLDRICELYEYTAWANGRILDAVGELSVEELERNVGGSFPSVRETLVHILGADWVWLSRWNGFSPSSLDTGWDLGSFSEIRRRYMELEADRAAFLAGLTDAALEEVIHYRNLAGIPGSGALWELLLHVVNHSTYHRGQVVTMLRQLGRSAPATDLVLFHRERARPQTVPT